MRRDPVARSPELANKQHYEVPAAFFDYTLGPRRKYSCCYYSSEEDTLQQAEEAALHLTCEHAEIENGMRILELGCGWGSLTLWLAENYPESNITAVSNSNSQRVFIEDICVRRGLRNVSILTTDMNDFEPPESDYDRVVSVEMFEHMRNWPALLKRIASWLSPAGKVFVHVFCHRTWSYPYESRSEADWMTRYFFSGGMMPSDDLLFRCQDDLMVDAHWRIDGGHYHKTCEAWLVNLDANRGSVLPLFEQVYGADDAARWLQRWRIFFMACSELFAYRGGREWYVSHYRLKQPGHYVVPTGNRSVSDLHPYRFSAR
jgi:cyclopropane-fatty-acyl-phospholipid synthase